MLLTDIYREFRTLKTSTERVEYIRTLQTLNLHFDINYDNLIEYWSTH